MENGTNNNKLIQLIKAYSCGYCENNLKHMYKNAPNKKVRFSARVLRIKHKKFGNILIDTGYSHRVFKSGIVSVLYSLFNPTTFESKNHILQQLKKDHVRLKDINTVILTHLHPDHIGGVLDLNSLRFVVSEGSKELFSQHSFKDLVFTSLINESLPNRFDVVKLKDQSPLEGFMGVDYLGDGSIWLIELEGHAKGQMGVYIEEAKLLYVADALWSLDYIDYDMRIIPSLIQNNYKKYVQNIEKLKALEGIQIVTTHGNEDIYYGQ